MTPLVWEAGTIKTQWYFLSCEWKITVEPLLIAKLATLRGVA